MMWQLFCVLPYLLATTGFVLPSVLSPSSNGPFQAAFRGQPESPTPGSDWEWNSPPNPNSTHHLIFNSVSGLLQRWPNTLRRNGHSLVPATIPKGTILYHGRADSQIPISPDWVAFDFEHSAILCRRSCHMITLQAKRDLRLVYFDGLSAGKMKDGPLDSQDVLLWGRPRPDKYFSELERIEALCDWGRPLGLDGFVRMEFHFEAMICDFMDALEVVSFLDLVPLDRSTLPRHLPGIPRPLPQPSPPKLPSGWRGSPPDMRRNAIEAFVTGTWHDRAPGETRVRPDYSGLVTFYDPSLSSLVEARHGKDRLHLRLEGISALDTEQVRDELRTVLTRERDGGSGIDWGSIVHVVTERYAGRLEYLRLLLSPNTTTFADALERAAVAREQLLVMLAPYITTTDVPQQLPASANLSWATLVAQRCATTQTSLIPLDILTPQEARIHAAAENTLHEICRRLVLVWAEFFDVEAADEAAATEATEVAYGQISELMEWLDWSEWVRCEPGCGLGEFCYIPSWPYFGEDDLYNIIPRCISFEGFARESGVSHDGS
ncbi:hypothetical protein EDB92DRAFT_2086455 [Lactarius akahatsu]|uniref:Uncharacterized protein n=1 Tax=Lactarius akahatsu TaxID=416441 RepID=A0AAD4LN05_9AGAM|nr:hypothetical protein EDB92DRAFT_2086455 [Lactarius akahatsu]